MDLLEQVTRVLFTLPVNTVPSRRPLTEKGIRLIEEDNRFKFFRFGFSVADNEQKRNRFPAFSLLSFLRCSLILKDLVQHGVSLEDPGRKFGRCPLCFVEVD